MNKTTEHVLGKETTAGSNGSSNEVVEQQPQKQRGWFTRTVRRFWWLLLILFAIGVLVVTLPLILVGFPRIIQKKLNDAQVTVQGIRMSNPTPTTVLMEMNSTLTSSGGISAKIDSFNASLYLEDKLPHVPFAYLTMPQTTSAKLVRINVSQELTMWNMDAFTDFTTWALLNESFRVTLDGDTLVHVKGLKAAKANFHKTVTLGGLNGFKGLSVSSFNISLTADDQGDNFHGEAIIPNPTVLTIEIGNTTFNTLLNQTNLGPLYIDNLTLYPGNNSVGIRANVSQSPVIEAITHQPYCQTGVLPLSIQGEDVVENGQHLSYYEVPLKQNLQTVPLNVSAALAAVLGGPVTCSSTSS